MYLHSCRKRDAIISPYSTYHWYYWWQRFCRCCRCFNSLYKLESLRSYDGCCNESVTIKWNFALFTCHHMSASYNSKTTDVRRRRINKSFSKENFWPIKYLRLWAESCIKLASAIVPPNILWKNKSDIQWHKDYATPVFLSSSLLLINYDQAFRWV
mgnify:CR=1 FL=1